MKIPAFLTKPLPGTTPDASLLGGPLAEKLLYRGAVLCCFFLSAGAILFYLSHPLYTNPDNSIYLEMADMILSGKVPYQDFFEWNPPLIMYLNILPVLLARLWSQPVTLCFNLLTLTSCLASAIFSLRLITRYMSPGRQTVFIPAVLAAVVHTSIQTVNFGEREHLFVIAYLPFFILRYLRWQGAPLGAYTAILAGLIGGLGLAMKPQFFLCAGAAELLMLLQRQPGITIRRCLIAPETAAALLPSAAHLALLASLPGKAWDVIFNQVIPLYNHGFKYSSRALMFMLKGHSAFTSQIQNFLIAAVLVFWLGRYESWLWSCLAFMLLALVNYLAGGQAWSYRMIPMDFAAYLIIGAAIGIAIKAVCSIGTSETRRWSRLVCAIAVFSTCWYAANYHYQAWRADQSELDFFKLEEVGFDGRSPERDVDPLFHVIVANTEPTDKVVFIGNGIEPGYPAILQSGRHCGSRYLFGLPMLIQYCIDLAEPGPDWQQLMKQVLKDYEEDINKNRPRLVLVQRIPMEALLREGGLYRTALKDYTLMGEFYGSLILLRNQSNADRARGNSRGAKLELPQKLLRETIDGDKVQSFLKGEISNLLQGRPTERENRMEIEIKRMQAELNSLRLENASLRSKEHKAASPAN